MLCAVVPMSGSKICPMENKLRRQRGTWRDACILLIFLIVTFSSACSFDESKLRARSSLAQDAATERSADIDVVQAGTAGTMEVGPVDLGSRDQSPLPTGIDAALGQDGQDTSGTNPDFALDADIDRSAAADAVQAETAGTAEAGQVDLSSTDQSALAPGIDASPGQDGSDASEALLFDGGDVGLGQDGQGGGDANPETNTDTNTAAGIVPDGTYRVIARHSGKALDVYGEATAEGSNVDQWTYDGGKNQQWAFRHLGANVYEIIGVQSSKALEVATTSAADDTNVDIRTYTGAANQKWKISAADVGYYRMTPVSSGGSALDVSSVSLSNGANVHQWTWLGGTNQQWSFQLP